MPIPSAQFGLPVFNQTGDPSLQVLNETGGTSLTNVPNAQAGGWDVEEALDVEWAHAVAPDANIILFEANSANFSDLLSAVQHAAGTAGVSAISMSWSGSEFSGESSYDSYFTTPSGHQGVTFLAATGDSGEPAGYPAYSPNVIAVGGTSLTLNSNGTYVSETGWADSGGGISTQEAIPSYQVGNINGLSSTRRAAPDVSMDADPNTGVYVYDSYYLSGSYLEVGGTSLATPMWAGLIAIANQGRVLNGLGTLNGATQTLPALYSLPSSDFHDITTGNNGYAAGSGYDLVTGLGTPEANLLVPALAGYGAAASAAPTITTNPVSQSLIAGNTATFTATATGTPAPIVQWELSTNNGGGFSTIAGATSTTLTVGSVTTSESGYEYEAVFTNSVGTATTTAATLTVTAPAIAPTITTNPVSQSVIAGANVTFTSAATGTPTPTVQWELSTNNGGTFAPISGATSTIFSIGTATVGESGYEYEAIFTNTVGTAATTAATLTVSQPSSGSLSGSYSAASASYNLTALGTLDWAHWGRGGNLSNFDHDAAGGSQISNVTKVGSGSYGGWTYSGRDVSWTNGTPTASDSGDDGYIWANNAIGAGFSFTVPASTTSQTLYIYLGGASSGGTLTATLSDSSASPYTATMSGTSNYQDVVAITYNAASAGQKLTINWVKSQTIGSAGGSVDLIAAWLTGPVQASKPTITTNPQSQSVTSGASVSFTAAATGTPTPTVQWQVNTNNGSGYSNIAGATSTTLSLGSVTVGETGYEYEAVFSNTAGTATTSPATLTVTAAAVAPTITTNPQSQSVTSGASVSFTAAATGTPTPTVQWEVSTNNGGTFAPISGATSTTFSLGIAVIGESGYEYAAVFTNTAGTATTSPATLTVTQSPPPSGGSLSGSSSTAAASYNLTTLGTADWAHWGRGGSASNFDHDATGGSQISNVTKLGPGSYGGWTYSGRDVSWTNGTPTASDSGDDGYIWANNAIGAGYSFTVPADTTSRTLYVYLGGSQQRRHARCASVRRLGRRLHRQHVRLRQLPGCRRHYLRRRKRRPDTYHHLRQDADHRRRLRQRRPHGGMARRPSAVGQADHHYQPPIPIGDQRYQRQLLRRRQRHAHAHRAVASQHQ